MGEYDQLMAWDPGGGAAPRAPAQTGSGDPYGALMAWEPPTAAPARVQEPAPAAAATLDAFVRGPRAAAAPAAPDRLAPFRDVKPENSPQKELFEQGPPSPAGPAPSKLDTAAAAFAQGLSSGWSDEIAGRMYGAMTKVPGLRDAVAKVLGDPDFAKPLTYEQARDKFRAYHEAARAANPKTYMGAELAGGAAQTFVPGARALGPVAGGALAGAGYSNADTAREVAEDAAGGAVLGKLLGTGGKLAGKGLQKVAASAPARVVARQVSQLGEGVKKSLRAQLASPEVERRVANIITTDKAVRGALNNPAELGAAADAGIERASAEAKPVYEAADAASAEARAADANGRAVDAAADTSGAERSAAAKAARAGRRAGDKARGFVADAEAAGVKVNPDLPRVAYHDAYGRALDRARRGIKEAIPTVVPDAEAKGGIGRDAIVAVFDRAADEAKRTSQNPHQVATIERLKTQFLEGLGKEEVVPSYDVRRFLSKQLQKPAFGGDPNVDPTAAKEATQALAIGLKKVLDEHVLAHAPPAAAAKLLRPGGLNDQITAYHVIGDVAAERNVGEKVPGVAGMAMDLIKGAKKHSLAALGGLVGGPKGAAVGLVLGQAPRVADRALASRAGQAAAAVAPRLGTPAGRVITQPAIDLLDQRRREAAP